MRRHRIARSFAVVVLGLALAAVPMSAEAGPRNGGNSPSAKQCQKGGWEELSPSTDPTIGFDSEQACTSHAAEGGTVVQQTTSITITFTPTSSPDFCNVVGQFRGLESTTEYTVLYSSYERIGGFGYYTAFPSATRSITTDLNGNADATFSSYYESGINGDYTSVKLTIDGVVESAYTEVLCS